MKSHNWKLDSWRNSKNRIFLALTHVLRSWKPIFSKRQRRSWVWYEPCSFGSLLWKYMFSMDRPMRTTSHPSCTKECACTCMAYVSISIMILCLGFRAESTRFVSFSPGGGGWCCISITNYQYTFFDLTRSSTAQNSLFLLSKCWGNSGDLIKSFYEPVSRS